MRLNLTDKEKKLFANVRKQCTGKTYEEIEQALAQLSGVVNSQRTGTVNKLIFHPQEGDSHEQGTSAFR